MKLQNIIYLYLCLVFVLSEDSNINLQKGKIVIEVDDNRDASFVFNAESIENNKYIYFRIKSVQGSLDSAIVKYAYVDSLGGTATNSELITKEGLTGEETEKLENNTIYDIRYFKIQKLVSEFGSHNGNYLYISITSISPGYVEISNTAKDMSSKPAADPTGFMDGIVKKYGTITVQASDYMVVFNVGDFDDGEEMYFKIKAETGAFYWNYIYYEYISSNIGYDDNAAKKSYFSLKSTYETTPSGYSYVTNYFTITKKKSEFRGTDGTYLLIYFWVDYGDVTITNTEEDEGKLETWAIVLIVIAVVVVIVLVIVICCCMRRRRRMQAMQMNMAQGGQYITPPNPAVNQVAYQQDVVYGNNY